MAKKLIEKQHICNIATQWAEIATALMSDDDAIELVCIEHKRIIYSLAAYHYAFYHDLPFDKGNIDKLVNEMLLALDFVTQNESNNEADG